MLGVYRRLRASLLQRGVRPFQVDDSQLLLSVGVAAEEGLDDSALGAWRDALRPVAPAANRRRQRHATA